MKTRPCSSPGSAHHSRCASRVSRDPSHPASVSLKRPSTVPCRSVPELPAVLWLPPTCNPHICALEQLFQSKVSWKEGRESSACEIKGCALPPDYWRGRAYPRTIKAEVHLTRGHLSQERTTERPIPWPRWRPYTHLCFFSLVPPTHCRHQIPEHSACVCTTSTHKGVPQKPPAPFIQESSSSLLSFRTGLQTVAGTNFLLSCPAGPSCADSVSLAILRLLRGYKVPRGASSVTHTCFLRGWGAARPIF